jgi:hypothetical protein
MGLTLKLPSEFSSGERICVDSFISVSSSRGERLAFELSHFRTNCRIPAICERRVHATNTRRVTFANRLFRGDHMISPVYKAAAGIFLPSTQGNELLGQFVSRLAHLRPKPWRKLLLRGRYRCG